MLSSQSSNADTPRTGAAFVKILVVEDESRISGFVRKGLTEKGFVVDVTENGVDGLHMATTASYDAVLLDIMLPGRDGLSVLKELRASGSTVPVILLTARDGIDDRVAGLDHGADDYITKPFFMEELIARLRAVTRRVTGASVSVLSSAGVVLNRMTREVTVGGGRVMLTAREFNLLELFLRSPGEVITRTQMLEKVWEYHFDPKTNIIEVYIQRLRVRLADAGAPDVIETVRGVGYRFRGEPSE